MELLERDEALCDLEAALQAALLGQGRVVLISGEAGIGKTCLVHEFIQHRADVLRVLWGACDALFSPRPLGPLHDIAPSMSQQIAILLDAPVDRSKLFAAVLDDLRHNAIATLMVIEDVHWADEATLDLIKYLARRIDQTPTLLVLTYRDDELSAHHPLRTVIGDLPRSSMRLPLTRLSEAAVTALAIAAHYGGHIHELYVATNGNPFFVTEVLSNLSSELPVTLRDAVLARAARLSLSGYATLEAAAMIGPRIELQLLDDVAAAETIAAEECIVAGMLYSEGAVLDFRHELARQIILASILPQRKKALHRLTLAALKSQPQVQWELARLAHHAAGADDRDAVLEYAPAAARQAAAVSAHREAAALYGLALNYADDMPAETRAHLLEDFANQCAYIDQLLASIDARRAAAQIRHARSEYLQEGENLASMVFDLWNIGDNTEAEQVSQRAIELLESLPESAQLALAYRAKAGLHRNNGDYSEAIGWGEKAIQVAQRVGAISDLAGAYNVVGAAMLLSGDARGRDYSEQCIAIGRESGFEGIVAVAFTNLGVAYGELYQFAAADFYLKDGIQYCSDRDLDRSRFYMLAGQALSYLHQGRWADATNLASTVLQRPNAAALSRMTALIGLGRLRTRRGDPGAMIALDEALELAQKMRSLHRLAQVHAARAEAEYLAGNLARARAEACAVYDLILSKQHAWITGELAFWRWRTGEKVALPQWLAQPFAMQIGGDWHAAAEAWQRMGCPYEQARALADGDVAAQLEGLGIFEQLGARPAAEVLRRKLDALPTRRIEKEAFGGLTERERDVAALIAQGRSNREIAAAMVVSVKTIETYITRILKKLGCDSRVQIATWALEKKLEKKL